VFQKHQQLGAERTLVSWNLYFLVAASFIFLMADALIKHQVASKIRESDKQVGRNTAGNHGSILGYRRGFYSLQGMICFRGLTVVLTASKRGKISQQFRAGIDLLSIDVQNTSKQGKIPINRYLQIVFPIYTSYVYMGASQNRRSGTSSGTTPVPYPRSIPPFHTSLKDPFHTSVPYL